MVLLLGNALPGDDLEILPFYVSNVVDLQTLSTLWSLYVNIVVRPVANYEACHTAVVAHLQAAIGNKFDQVLAFGTFLFQVL